MDYRRADDELFGKYCYIDTPWIAGEKTIYRIVRSGVRSNAWCEVPVKFKDKAVTHNYSEDIVFVVLDTLIDENTKIKRFALKDIVLAEQTEPQYDFGKYSDRLWKIAYERGRREALEQTEPQTCSTCKFDHKEWYEPECDSCCDSNSNWQPKDEPQTERPCDNCQEFDCYGCEHKQTDCGWK